MMAEGMAVAVDGEVSQRGLPLHEYVDLLTKERV